MTLFLANLLLAGIWAAMMGELNLANLVLGLILGYVALFVTVPFTGDTGYFRRLPQVVAFFAWFVWEIIKSNLQVAWDVVTPSHHATPGVVAIPLDVTTAGEITLLANLITLTPGTLSLDVSDDRKTLYIHAMFIDDPDEVRRYIKENLERRVLELFG
jgi:multicomponent Na+:H+ antiporter subunit E